MCMNGWNITSVLELKTAYTEVSNHIVPHFGENTLKQKKWAFFPTLKIVIMVWNLSILSLSRSQNDAAKSPHLSICRRF